MTERNRLALAALGLLLLGVLAYWPALDNPFIADDYALLMGAEKAAAHCTALLEMPLSWRRLLSNFFFTACFALFGLAAGFFYLANLGLHLINSFLVLFLVRRVTGEARAGIAAALFFVVYERHQEPVFWIGASHELLLSLGVLGTTLAFLRYRRSGRRGWYALALAVFLAAAFTKESFLILPPVLVLADWCVGKKQWREGWRAHAPFWALTGLYLALMYLGPWQYPFSETQSGLTPHFFGVYLRSLNRLLLFVYAFFVLAWAAGRLKRVWLAETLRQPPVLFFLGWLLLTIAPYSFILYERQLSSRHAYIPSVAVAGLVGWLWARAWAGAGTRAAGLAWVAVLALVLMANVAYLWRKDADYLERAAPTDQLIAALNREAPQLGSSKVVVYDFPQPLVVARGAARFFTRVSPQRLIFRRSPQTKKTPPGSLRLRWNPAAKRLDVLTEDTPQ